MGQKHKHAELIKQWAEGAIIEWRAMPTHPEWEGTAEPGWKECLEYRIKPEPPAKVYPVTGMTDFDLNCAANNSEGYLHELRLVAIAALRHAIDSGQLVDPSTYMADVRDLAAKRNTARDMAIAEAVRNACRRPFEISHKSMAPTYVYGVISGIDLPLIISRVKD